MYDQTKAMVQDIQTNYVVKDSTDLSLWYSALKLNGEKEILNYVLSWENGLQLKQRASKEPGQSAQGGLPCAPRHLCLTLPASQIAQVYNFWTIEMTTL